ncbi:MAG: hypothetical protein ACYC3X_04845 [Pirellulaceae bacterium]
MIPAITTISCFCAAAATIGMLALAVLNYNPGSWESIVIVGGWDVAVYAGVVLLAVALRESRRASVVMLLGAVFIGGFSVLILYGDLSAYFTPPTPRHRVMNCVGPIIELGLPLLQWPTLGAFAAVAFTCRGSRRPTSLAR